MNVFDTVMQEVDARIKQALSEMKVNFASRRNRGVVPGRNLPTTGNTGSGYTPAAHAVSHKNGGSDEVATATPAANAIPKAGSGGTIADGWLSAAIARLADLTAIYLALADVTTTPTASKVPRADGSGDLADGWLSSNVPLKSTENTYTQEQTFDVGVLIKQSLDAGQTMVIPAGYAHAVPQQFAISGTVQVSGLLRVW